MADAPEVVQNSAAPESPKKPKALDGKRPKAEFAAPIVDASDFITDADMPFCSPQTQGARCEVCFQDSTGPMLTCVDCAVVVHQSCYGVPVMVPPGCKWTCQRCNSQGHDEACVLCGVRFHFLIDSQLSARLILS